MTHDRAQWALLPASLALAAVIVGACASAQTASPVPSVAPDVAAALREPGRPVTSLRPRVAGPGAQLDAPATAGDPHAEPGAAAVARREGPPPLPSRRRTRRLRPARTELPRGASVGVECRPDDPLVARVGIYGFGAEADEAAVLAMYFDRLAEHGVSPASGDCEAGIAGDASWPDYLPDRDEDGGYRPTRAGCFIDENGNANIRVLCYGPYYIGILGRNGDLKALDGWAWQVSEQQGDDRDPPGICGAPD